VGILSPLVLVCLIFVVVGIAGHKQDEQAPQSPEAMVEPKSLEPVDSSPGLPS
jgi:hypothetical protein